MPTTLSCPTASTCMVAEVREALLAEGYSPVGQSTGSARSESAAFATTSDGGATWSTHLLPAGIQAVADLTCTSATFCMGLGGSLFGAPMPVSTTDGGATWRVALLPAAVSAFFIPDGLSCPSSGDCVVSAQGVLGSTQATLVTTDGGATWSVHSATAAWYTGRLVCASTTTCIAIGLTPPSVNSYAPPAAALYETTDAGASWAALSLPPAMTDLTTLACASSSFCLVGGENTATNLPVLATTANGGASFSTFTPTNGITGFGEASCAAAGTCAVVATSGQGDLVMNTTDGGTTWTDASEIPAGSSGFSFVSQPLSCPAAGTCWSIVMDGSYFAPTVGELLGTTDAGVTWTSHDLPGTGYTLNAITCASALSCVAVGTGPAGGVAEATTGASPLAWGAPVLVAPGADLSAVACPTVSECFAAGTGANGQDGAVFATTDGGATWSPVAFPTGTGDITEISCNSPTACSAVSVATQATTTVSGNVTTTSISEVNDVYRTTDGGSTWSAVSPAVVGSIAGLSCPPGTATCYLAGDGNGGFVLALNGSTWSLIGTPGGNLEPGALTCPGASTCDVAGVPPPPASAYDTFPPTKSTVTPAAWLTTTNGGATWHPVTMPAPPPPDASLLTPPMSGYTPTALETSATIEDATCPSASSCTATEYVFYDQWFTNATGGVIDQSASDLLTLTTSNGGSSWSTITIPAVFGGGYQAFVPGFPLPIGSFGIGGGSSFGPLACPSPASCLALGSDGVHSDVLVDTPFPNVSSVSPASAPTAGGTTITVTGSGFSSATAVHVGTGAATNVRVVSGTEITATVPAATGPGRVDVTVTTPSGTSPATPADGFLYVSSGDYTPLVPYRVCDTRGPAYLRPVYACTFDARSPFGSIQPGNVGPGMTLAVSVAPSGSGADAVPADASAVIVNVTAIGPNAPGYLTVYPDGVAEPVASNLNYANGQTVAGLAEVAVGASGVIDIANGSTGPLDIAVDVEGYVAPTGGDTFNPLTPHRACDTRSGTANPCAGRTLGPDQTLGVVIAPSGGASGVPGSAVAVVLNVTATDTTANGGYLTVWPAGAAKPGTSNLNFNAGRSVANRVVVPVGSGGVVDVANALGSADVVIDVSGYFSASGGAAFSPMAPVRACDTRTGTAGGCAKGALGPAATLTLTLAGHDGVPVTAKAVVLVVTATDTTANGGYLTVWPAGGTQPVTSDVNFDAGETVANLVVVKIGAGGAVKLTNAFGSTDVIADVAGWYS